MTKAILAYIPGLHQGYFNFFKKHFDAEVLYILGLDIISGFRNLIKDIRAIEPKYIKLAIQSWEIFSRVEIIDLSGLKSLANSELILIVPDEDECRDLAQNYFSHDFIKQNVIFERIFLRWDRTQSLVNMDVKAKAVISSDEFNVRIMGMAEAESNKSIDWWRQIGAIAVRSKEIIFVAHNVPATSCHVLHLFGDPRSNFTKGKFFEISLFDHAEPLIVARAARGSFSLSGADLYLTTFPCPVCAKLIAHTGIKRLFYREGYSVLDGEEVLRKNNIEIILVN